MSDQNTLISVIAPAFGALVLGLAAHLLGLEWLEFMIAGAAVAALIFWAGRRKQQPAPAPSPVSESAGHDSAAMFERLPAAVVMVDRSLKVRRINPAAAELIGAATDGAPLVSLLRAPGFIEAVEGVLKDDAPRSAAFQMMRDRTELSLISHIRSLPGADARAPAALILIEDQTRVKRIEQMRQDFIANASHELKTPLASIMGFIETLQGPAREDEAARTRFLGIMATQAERMKRLVEDLMSLSRIEVNLHVRPTEALDLGALARSTAAAMEPVAADRGATVKVAFESDGPVITGDKDQLAQLITNLIDNAIKYGGEGVSVTLSHAKDAPEWPGMTGLTVSDTGPGIPREHIPRLTERFYRVSVARSRAVGGTGLGLAIAKHILQRHRGSMSVKSTPGEGSAFTIWLPKRSEMGGTPD